jgi:WD40 repeat protein
MKKHSFVFLILLCFFFSIIKVTPASAANIFKEGVYKAVDFNFSPDSTYFVQNISDKSSVSIFLFDENQIQIQSILLKPKSKKYNLLPLSPDYRIVIVGNGDIFIN